MPAARLRCSDHRCDWQGEEDLVLIAPHPFQPEETIQGCPACREIGTLQLVCDEPDCWQPCSCGTPTPDGGYRRTCFWHRPSDGPKPVSIV